MREELVITYKYSGVLITFFKFPHFNQTENAKSDLIYNIGHFL